jgi:hypothetical protein
MAKPKQTRANGILKPTAGALSIEAATTAVGRLNLPNPKAAPAFEPYRGAEKSKPPPRKKDLRKLGEWLETKRKAEELKRQEEILASQTQRSAKN